MVFSRSHVLLHLACKTGQATRLVSRNASKGSSLFKCSSVDTLKDKSSSNIIESDLLGKETVKNTGYADRLKEDVSIKENKNAECNNDAVKVFNNLHQLQDVEFLKDHDYKFDDALEDIDVKLPGPLDPCTEDLSHIGPNITATFNFAKFADKSHTLQQLVKLGVELYKLEANRDVVELFLKLDFERDMKPYIRFLHDCGVQSENLGYFITRNPTIFKEDMDDLYTRIRYLRAHNFTPDMIQKIVNKHPPWLSFKTQELDRRLGHFQHTFSLSGHKIRLLTTMCPQLITYNMNKIRHSTFSIKEEMGFKKQEMQLILLRSPRVWIRARIEVVKSFDYLHNQMQLSHTTISQQSHVLLCRRSRLERRHQFLVELKRDQYDPAKPLYVSPLNLVTGSDVEFCNNVAKASINTYNMFLKSL